MSARKAKMTLQEYLEKERLSLSEFAKASSVPIATLSRFISGQRGLSLESAIKISDATGNKVAIVDLTRAAWRSK